MDGQKFHLAKGDAVEWLRRLPAESVDLAITDPPYESLEKHRAVGTTTRLKHSKASSNDWFSIFPNARFPELFAEVYRVLRRNAHFYLYCDPETMFVAKPVGEAAGFKFWKPLIWDKCLAPDTLVWTTRGVVRIDQVVEGDRVAIPEGGTSPVVATRRTHAPSVKLTLSDGTELVASRDHRFLCGAGRLSTAAELRPGDVLARRDVRERVTPELALDELIPDDEAIYELPDTSACLWCGQAFDGPRAAAAHQARFCEDAWSKKDMAAELGVRAKQLPRWLRQGRVPRDWAKRLGLEPKLGERVQTYLQNDVEMWFPRRVKLDYDLGRFVGLFAAEGTVTASGITFAFHAHERQLHRHVARVARSLGARARIVIDGDSAQVDVSFKVARYLIEHFVGGDRATNKYFRASVYAAPAEFRRGVYAGLDEGDGSWSDDEQRSTFRSASPDLAAFAHRALLADGFAPTIRRFENDHAGGWVVRHDPKNRTQTIEVVAIEDVGQRELVDVSIADRDELFMLANGVVTHNCSIGMGYHYRARYECILFFEKGKRKLDDLGVADIIEHKRIVGGYPAEKPPAVSEVLIKQSSDRGQVVIDPFTGSGSVGVAALMQGREFWGNDLCHEAVDIARERLLREGGVEIGATPKPGERPGQLGLGV
jgi:DNA modification methylase|nr:DNA methyltransferase [Kofleriaceae bacterium]